MEAIGADGSAGQDGQRDRNGGGLAGLRPLPVLADRPRSRWSRRRSQVPGRGRASCIVDLGSASRAIVERMVMFCIRQRRPSTLGYQSPVTSDQQSAACPAA